MRPTRLLPALLLAALCPSLAAAQPRASIPVVPLDRYQWIGELVGSCWQGSTAEGKPADTQCYTVQFDRFVRATTTRAGDRGKPVEGEMVIAWSPRNGQYDVAEWFSDGTFRVQEATLFKGVFRFWSRKRDGADPTERTIWRRYGKDRFEVALERRNGEVWREVKTTSYERVKPAP